ncbi:MULTISPECIES: hypothetical protein [Leptolyngbya]|uniref:Uncharacterized protein n=2 Tax=Leptolyngbya boryana TaxID=1184 RepID=A0A1Z4JCJ4_LEPBY|nr:MULTISPECIES: hypothetical protein [Leptolyngbya]BAY54514.1 hypothetical protein NIES2135_13310 [Leptolyngbya boryana NIES-2135]MBD1859914.1 hypothetical protein [Leptolyngbya sp. FACHB-1624]MBD2365508.1 hypothetical protein [Leptolyngbya sp. FACHB-161]MBD2371688.1 hypothetical protein [Leptolyngbya sp. FACHB-238]MBD2396113.1 hypothetical protein [Leptolyngbya sp. FACHB-239]
MHIGSEATAPKRSHPVSANFVVNLVGTAIALITLILPIVVISHYAPESPQPIPTKLSN